jgi:hypothetical protein
MNSTADMIYEAGEYFVVRASYGFDVYRNTNTHSVRVARIGYTGRLGLDRAKAEIERRRAQVTA